MRRISPRCGKRLRTGKPCTRPKDHSRSCHSRTREESTAWYISTDGYKTSALRNARERAKKKGLPFALTLADIPDVPECCPVFGYPISPKRGNGTAADDSPSLDRMKPRLGYVPDNVRWISNRANRFKSDATVEEMRLVLADIERIAA